MKTRNTRTWKAVSVLVVLSVLVPATLFAPAAWAASRVYNYVGVTASNPTTQTVLDQFSSQAYNRNDGTVSWSTTWVEDGDSGTAQSPSSGQIQITTSGSRRLRIGDGLSGTPSISRTANLTGSTFAVLSFDYTTSGNLEGSDFLYIEVSTGGSWVGVANFSNDVSGSASYDISSYISSNTRVRFRANCDSSDEYWYVDNVQIAFFSTPCAAGSFCARASAVTQFPYASSLDRLSFVQATNTQYSNISARDISDWITADPDTNNENFVQFDMSISEPITSIASIDLTFRGYTNGGSTEHRIYVQRANTNWWQNLSWVQVGTSQSFSSETEMLRSITSNISDYINPTTGAITWGVYETRSSASIRVDYVEMAVVYNYPPTQPTNQTPASGAFTALGNPQFIWSAFGDPNPGDTQTHFQVQLRTQGGAYGGAGSQDSGSVASATNTYTPGSWNLGDGTYCWHVRVQDNYNAWSGYSTDTCFTVDRTAPTSAATSPAYDNGGSIAVNWTASDNAGGSGVSSVVLWYRLNAGAWTNSGMSQSGSAGTFNFNPPGGTNGTYYFQTIATDVVGNVEAGPAGNGDDSTVYDTTPPTSQATPPAGPINAPPIAIPWTADGAVSGIATNGILLRYNLNGSAYADGPTASGTSGTFNFTPSSGGGTYCFYTIATDNAGNVEAAPGGANGDGCTIFNTPPVAVDDGYGTPEDTPLTVAAPGVLTNDSDADGNALTATREAGPASGTLVLNANGSFVYTPALNFNGVVTFTYHANDGIANSNTATVTITVTAVNDAPVALPDDGYGTPEDTPLTVAAPGVLTNDSDADGDPLTAVLNAGPASGTLVLNANGSFVYTPASNFNGVVTFTYHANDGTANSNTATVTITVTPSNDAPVAVNDGYSTPEDTPLTVAAPGVLTNDSDADGDALTAIREAGPAFGTLVLNADGSFVYTPVLNFNGVVTFTYHANDGTANSNTATVTIAVTPLNDAPVAVDDGYSTPEDTPLTITVPGVLANDSDADGNALTAIREAGPASGTLVLNANGSFVYTPALNFNGVVTFTYHASDGTANSNTTTVTITVTAFNDAPVALPDDGYSTPEDTPLIVAAPGVLANDSDADGNALTAVQEAGPASGTLVLNADGSFVYTPALDFNGVVTFTYHASDGTANSNTATVTITVTESNDAPVAVGDGYSTPEDTPLTVAAPGVLANDSDADAGDALTAVQEAGPASGTLVLNANGSFVYTPALNFNGVVTFTYHASDGTADSNIATVTITVTPVNDAPVAVDDSYRTLRNTPLIAAQGDIAAPGVLDNDSDADAGDALTAVREAGPASGTLVLDADGSFVYTPALNFNGVVTFTYHANDGTTDSNTATVTVTVTEFNDAPVAVDDSYSTPEDTPLTVAARGVLTNDSDADGDALAAVREAGPASGTLVLDADGSFVYTPALNFSGVVTFTYHANDGIANSNTATVTITITALNDAPAFTSTPVTNASEGVAYTYDVTAADVDNAVTDLTIAAPTRPGWLTLTDNGDGTATLTGIPTHTDIGDHPVVLQVSDGAATTTQSFTITVSAKGMYYVYLPVIFRNYVVAPDLVVQSLTATSSSVQMVIVNQGNAPVTDEFWVDVYIDPQPIPTSVNQIWPDYASQGFVWGVTADALPLAPGETLTLTIGDAYYVAEYSSFSGSLAAGTPVYAQVDSANFNTSYGGVLEDHEILGGSYNNIASTLSAARSTGAALSPTTRAGVFDGLPPRK